MSTTSFTPILNWENRINKSGLYPVHLRITINRRSKYLAIKIPQKVRLADWSGKDGMWVRNTHLYAFEINNQIREIKYKIEELNKRFYLNGRQLSFKDIAKHLKFKGDGKCFNQYVSEYIRLKPQKLEVATWEKYQTFLNHLNEFNSSIYFENLSPEMVLEFKRYLEVEKGFLGSTVKVYFDKFQKVVNYAAREKFIDKELAKELFEEVEVKVNKAKRVYLEVDEVKALREKTFPDNFDGRAWQRDRDLFLLQIYTGYYYNDLKILKKTDLRKDSEYGYYIMGERDKNGNDTIIPLFKFPNAISIIETYRDDDPNTQLLFPKSIFVEPQVYNRTLKKIAGSLNIRKDISGKVARHTNAQLWVRYGAERPIISKMLGHTKEETTNHYFTVNLKDVIEGTSRVNFEKLGI